MNYLDLLASPRLHLAVFVVSVYVAYRLYWRYVYFDGCVAYRHSCQKNDAKVVRLVIVKETTPAYIYGMLRDRDYRMLDPDECRSLVKNDERLGSIWDHVISIKDGRYYESMLRSAIIKPLEIRSDRDARDKMVFATKDAPASTQGSGKKSALQAAV